MERSLAVRWARMQRGGAGPRARASGRRREAWRGHVVIERGTMADYAALARFHYRVGPPATRVLILRARVRRTGELAGVLVVSMPTLHGSARRAAWPGAFAAGDAASRAARVNREVRTISRVVVDPRYRGLGIAAGLVRTYLRGPLTSKTEAVAAMGAYCPFFRAAGMREVEPPAHARDVRLARALRRARVAASRLLDERDVKELGRRRPELRRALRAWARAARPPRELATARTATIARAAGMALVARPRAYVWECPPARGAAARTPSAKTGGGHGRVAADAPGPRRATSTE